MQSRRSQLVIGLPLVLTLLWLLPQAVGSRLIAGCLTLVVIGTVLWGRSTHHWRPLMLLATLTVTIDLFGLTQLWPVVTGLVIAVLWLAGLWLIGYIDRAQHQIFHQALTSFLVLEVFLVLQLWPSNGLSKAVILVAFVFFLWLEFVRVVPPRQRLVESVLPFLLIVMLMTLTARWFVL